MINSAQRAREGQRESTAVLIRKAYSVGRKTAGPSVGRPIRSWQLETALERVGQRDLKSDEELNGKPRGL